MTGQIADHFAQRKIVTKDEFLEGTGRTNTAVGNCLAIGWLLLYPFRTVK
jgi:hypothetical protein